MAKQGDREPETDPNFPPGLTSQGDRFLYRKMEDVESLMSEIVTTKIEPLNEKMTTIVLTFESLSKAAENIEKIREEFTGFRSFREQFEGYKKTANKYFWLAVLGPIGSVGIIAITVWSAGLYFGSTMSAINVNVGNMKDSVKELEVATKELNATTKVQGEHLKNVDEQLKAVQVSLRETAKAVAETSDKSSERIAEVLEAFEKRSGKNNTDLGTKIDAIERKLEETSDVLVLSLNLSSDDKPEAKSDTHLGTVKK